MIKNQHKATVILGAVSVAFFSSYPFRDSFLGGLLTGGFGAAMIGGLADWFAVTALFRRPLGIPFRTNIIPRNREKIFQALVHLVENQLLVKENIKSRLNDSDMASIIVNIMLQHGGNNVVKRMLYAFISEILIQVRPAELGRIMSEIIQKTINKTPISLYILSSAEWLMKNNDTDKMIKFLLKQCILLAKHERVKILLSDCFIAARKRYEEGMTRRKFFNQLLQVSEEEVGTMVQQIIIDYLTEMQDETHPLRQKFKKWSLEWLAEKKTDVVFQEKADTWLRARCKELDIAQYITSFITEFRAGALADPRQRVKWLEILTKQIDKKIAGFAQNPKDREEFNSEMRKLISNWLDGYHGEIGKMVMDSLSQFTDKMLVEFIEDKIGNDLQMVRINGSVVGGFVGMILYIMTFWL